MTRGRSGRRALAAACLLALVGSGCTPSAPPPPPPTSTPSPTLTENPQEREERLAYEAAEKSYREFRAEFDRVLTSGGARDSTSRMTQTAGGQYLKDNVDVVQAYKGLGYRQTGTDRIVYIKRDGYAADSVSLATCEDSSKARTLDKKNQLVGYGDIRRLSLEVRNSKGIWKVWSGRGIKVKSCGA